MELNHPTNYQPTQLSLLILFQEEGERELTLSLRGEERRRGRVGGGAAPHSASQREGKMEGCCRGHEHSGAKVRLHDHTSVIMRQVLLERDITIAINYNVHS